MNAAAMGARILHEVNGAYVWRGKSAYEVFRPAGTVARLDCSFPLTPDGLTLSKARVDYLGNSPAGFRPGRAK